MESSIVERSGLSATTAEERAVVIDEGSAGAGQVAEVSR